MSHASSEQLICEDQLIGVQFSSSVPVTKTYPDSSLLPLSWVRKFAWRNSLSYWSFFCQLSSLQCCDTLKFNRKSKTNEVSSLFKIIICQWNVFRTFKVKHWSGRGEQKARLSVCSFSLDVLVMQEHAIPSSSPSSYGHSVYKLKILTVLTFRRPLESAVFISQTGKWSDRQSGLIKVKQWVCSSALNCMTLSFAFIYLPILAFLNSFEGKKRSWMRRKENHTTMEEKPHTWEAKKTLLNLLESLQQGPSCTL